MNALRDGLFVKLFVRVMLITAALAAFSGDPVQALPGGTSTTGPDSGGLFIPDPSPIAAAPINDNMSGALVATIPYSHVTNTTEATVEAGEPAYSCGYNVGKTVWYSYTAASDGLFAVSTNGSDFDTVVHVFVSPGMTLEKCNADGGDDLYDSFLYVEGAAGTTYLISVGGDNGAYGSLQFDIFTPTPFSNCLSVDVSEAECTALTNLYADTGGASWTNMDGWLQTDEVCNWFGIMCSTGYILQINLSLNNLSGELSTDLTGLSNTYYLYLSDNNLNGALSTVVPNLPPQLFQLTLAGNDFTGNLPASLASLTNLLVMNLGNNQLSGDIATAVGNLPSNMHSLILYYNDFTGEIPDMTGLTNLSTLNLSHNSLTGTLDSAISNLPDSMYVLDLGANNFTGTVPASLLDLSILLSLNLSENQLEGDLSSALGNIPTSVAYMYLDFNDFTGTIPPSISSFTSLLAFGLTGNSLLMGTVPMEITSLTSVYAFSISGTYLCEPPDPGYAVWIASLSSYFHGICGYVDADLAVQGITFTPAAPSPGETFTATAQVRNIGGAATPSFWVEFYDDHMPTGCGDHGIAGALSPGLDPGETAFVGISIAGIAEGSYETYLYADPACDIPEDSEPNNIYGPEVLNVSGYLFEDDFETGDLSQWTQVNTGGGFLTACTDAAMNGIYGACVERGTNDQRKQLIDQTPADETAFNARFNFDVNSLSMGVGEPVRIMQWKMGAERPVFLVLRYVSGVYSIQLNVKEDALNKIKTPWIVLSDAPHTIEVSWAAATSDGANDGNAALYIDDVLQASLNGLDNDTLTILSFRLGFTSRLVGKSITGIFYIDDAATSNTGHIGIPIGP